MKNENSVAFACRLGKHTHLRYGLRSKSALLNGLNEEYHKMNIFQAVSLF